jgi:hypothetical protein
MPQRWSIIREVPTKEPQVALVSADSTDAGMLGVPYLKGFWTRIIASRTGNSPPLSAGDMLAETLLLAGLNLNVREAMQFLTSTIPSFEEFENWVLTTNGGSIDPVRLARLNSALQGGGAFKLESILPEPVLSAEDLEFWNEQGYVLVKRVVTRDACLEALDAIFAYADMSIDQPDSWYKGNIWIPLAHHPALSANRNSPRIHTAFAQIWGRTDLWVNVDVCGVNPPLRRGYSFQGTPLHWDVTLAPPVRFGTQAILYLIDTAANHGAFSCVPGFHRRLETWLREMPAGVNPREIARRELQAVPIAGEAGDLIIWHQALPHAATSNQGTLPRVVQYLNMFPSQYEVNAMWV